LAGLYEKCYASHAKKWGAVRRLVQNAGKKDFANVGGNFGAFTCLVDGGEVKGFCGIKSGGDGGYQEVSRFVVEDSYRGQGWGKKVSCQLRAESK
jgi:hypothetical protein